MIVCGYCVGVWWQYGKKVCKSKEELEEEEERGPPAVSCCPPSYMSSVLHKTMSKSSEVLRKKLQLLFDPLLHQKTEVVVRHRETVTHVHLLFSFLCCKTDKNRQSFQFSLANTLNGLLYYAEGQLIDDFWSLAEWLISKKLMCTFVVKKKRGTSAWCYIENLSFTHLTN